MIKPVYQLVKSIVKYNNCLSEEFTLSWSSSGDCLSPLLFSLYLNDLENEFAQNSFEGVDIGILK